MSNRIATNFDYQAKEFLDQRQGRAKTKEDLKNWSVSVPIGFKVCLDESWYYYDPTKDLPETGHWVPTVTNDLKSIDDPERQTVGAGVVEGIQGSVDALEEDLQDLDNSVYPTSIGSIVIGPAYNSVDEINLAKDDWIARISNNISSQLPYDADLDWNENGTIEMDDVNVMVSLYNRLSTTKLTKGTGATYTLEFGESILPRFTWKVIKPLITWKLTPSMSIIWSVVPGTENNTVPIKGSEVVSTTKGRLDKDNLGWTAREIVTSDKKATITYNITSTVSDKVQVNGSCSIVFEHKRWVGSSGIDIWNKDTVKPWEIGFSSVFTSNGAMPNTNFNCSGGKYPYILIPKDYYSAARKTYVNNNLNSDFLVKDITVVNSKGVSIPYKMYRTNYIQTGSAIAIKIE